MKLLIQPPDGNCCIYSLAMILDVEPQEIYTFIGHDGNKRVWNLPGNRGNIGFHINELQAFTLSKGRCLYPIDFNPVSYPEGEESGIHRPHRLYESKTKQATKFMDFIAGKLGLLIGKPNYLTVGHCVAWDRIKIYDPNGRTLKLFTEFEPYTAWMLGNEIKY